MKNKFLNLIFFLIVFYSYAQIESNNTQKIEYSNNQGRSNAFSEILDENEGEFMNEIFDAERKNFDFKNKKLGYISGNSGNTKRSKLNYLKFLKETDNKGNLILFNQIDKIKSGYDGVIIYWSKISPSKNSIFRTLRKKLK